MGHIEDRWLKNRDGQQARTSRYGRGLRYRVRYVDPDGTERSKAFPDRAKREAEKFLATMESDVLRGQYVSQHDRTTVAEYARAWADARPHRPSTERRVGGLIKTHIDQTRLGARPLVSVRPSEVQAWATERSQFLAPSTLRNLVSLLSSVYRSAVLDRLVASSPVVGLQLPSAEDERVVPLIVDEVRALAEAIPARNRAMVIAQAGLGLRIGELLALRLAKVDFLRRTVRIDEQIAPGAKIRSEPKTPRSRRTLPLPDVVASSLAEHIAKFPPAPDGTLFTTRTGAPYRHDYYGAVIFKAAVRAAGLPPETSTHALRHHYASVLLEAGESVVAVAERLGHKNANLVLSTYGHLMPDSETRTRVAVDAAWDGPTAARKVSDTPTGQQ